jgi:hypothetical protein
MLMLDLQFCARLLDMIGVILKMAVMTGWKMFGTCAWFFCTDLDYFFSIFNPMHLIWISTTIWSSIWYFIHHQIHVLWTTLHICIQQHVQHTLLCTCIYVLHRITPKTKKKAPFGHSIQSRPNGSRWSKLLFQIPTFWYFNIHCEAYPLRSECCSLFLVIYVYQKLPRSKFR